MKELHAAARAADADKVRELLRSGADPNEWDGSGYTPLLWAAFLGAVGDQVPVIRALVEAGADVNAVTVKGDSTVLMLAAQAGNPAVIRLLLESGARVDQAADGVTPLMVAATSGSSDAARLLLEFGADAGIRAGRFTAADYARHHGHNKLATFLDRADGR